LIARHFDCPTFWGCSSGGSPFGFFGVFLIRFRFALMHQAAAVGDFGGDSRKVFCKLIEV
jgi:hypothetical protein